MVYLTELNKDWREVEQKNTIWNATSSWRYQPRVQVSNNTPRKKSGEFQVGGTAMIGFNKIVYKISKQGNDISKLGWWSWIIVTGKNNVKTTIITCYCSCKGTSTGSLYPQYLVYMDDKKTL